MKIDHAIAATPRSAVDTTNATDDRCYFAALDGVDFRLSQTIYLATFMHHLRAAIRRDSERAIFEAVKKAAQ
jgi:hypothetical protein